MVDRVVDAEMQVKAVGAWLVFKDEWKMMLCQQLVEKMAKTGADEGVFLKGIEADFVFLNDGTWQGRRKRGIVKMRHEIEAEIAGAEISENEIFVLFMETADKIDDHFTGAAERNAERAVLFFA